MQELLKLLTDQLGVNEGQARGGAGLLFKLAKEKLGGTDFSRITDAIGNVDELVGAAPAEGGGGLGGLLGKVASAAGQEGLGDLASLVGGFQKLDLDAGSVGKFIPVILDFVKSKGGDSVAALLQQVLK